jgi:hypothetical protein
MRTLHVIEAELYGAEGALPGAEEFMVAYAEDKTGPTTTYVFRDVRRMEDAAALLAEHGLKHTDFYIFDLEADEVSAYPAFYLGVHVVWNLFAHGTVDAAPLDEFDIVKDYETEHVVVSTEVRKILEDTTSGLTWSAVTGTDGQQRFLMMVTTDLSDPIDIPAPVEIAKNKYPIGTYSVRSDGRDVITMSNVSTLAETGIAVSHEARIPSGIVKWRARLLASGRVVSALRSAGVKGILEPLVPLITEAHPLALKRKR